ncbi:hypothetical protein KACC15558_15990 [Brevibacterium ammoniilyticum]|uniref:Uncharacterized protein n=1 Tax=Brevibacterium ammoniilyticum TaxID=1046555 RepID=A0ABP9U0A9_9MICO
MRTDQSSTLHHDPKIFQAVLDSARDFPYNPGSPRRGGPPDRRHVRSSHPVTPPRRCPEAMPTSVPRTPLPRRGGAARPSSGPESLAGAGHSPAGACPVAGADPHGHGDGEDEEAEHGDPCEAAE